MSLRPNIAASGDIADIRQVTLYFYDATTQFLIHKDSLQAFVEAQTKLHFEPGVNPHNQREAKKIWKITASSLCWDGPFWWSTADLQNNFDPAGAKILDGRKPETVWIDQKTVDAWRAEDERAEYEADTGLKLEGPSA